MKGKTSVKGINISITAPPLGFVAKSCKIFQNTPMFFRKKIARI
jgi:hypothetical protein